MPTDNPADTEAKLAKIREDLKYYKQACLDAARSFTTTQPPTIYAAKYVEDMEFLLGLAAPTEPAPEPKEESQLELALRHDQAIRVK